MKNIHPIVAGLVSQQVLHLAVKTDSSAEFINDLRVNTNNPALQTENGRNEAFMSSLADLLGVAQERKLYNVHGGNVAVIPLHGSLINRFNSSWTFITGYKFIRNAINMALEDSEIETIVLDVNSNGGEVCGCFEIANFIKEAKNTKPIHAVVDGSCYSAAYAIASACSTITTTPSSGIGSIGVVAVHASYEKMLDNEGIAVTIIQAGDKKSDGTPYKNLTDSAKTDIQQRVNDNYAEFTALVADNRHLSVDDVIKTQAACYTAKDAMELGLIDAVTMSVDETISDFINQPEKGQQTMTKEVQKADAGADERKRIQTIIGAVAGCAGVQNLANHLAFNTALSAEEATAILEASKADYEAQAKQAKPVETAEAVKDEPNHLAEAMAQNGSPNVGADNADAEKAQDAVNMDLVANYANAVNVN